MLQVTWLLLTNESVLFQIKVAILLWKLFMTSNPGWEKWKLLWIIFTKKMSQGSIINCKKFFMLFLPKILIMEKSIFLPLLGSVTRFGEISPLWHNLKVLGKFLKVYFVFCKFLILLWQKCYTIGQVFMVPESYILKNKFAIWSHCFSFWRWWAITLMLIRKM